MIALDEIRQALEAKIPTTEVDRLIRRELAGYRTTGDIHRELVSYLPHIKAWPVYDEEHEEDFEGMLGALFGMCHRDQAYRTIPRPNETAIEGPAETISTLLSHLPAEDRLKVLDLASDLVRAQIKIPA